MKNGIRFLSLLLCLSVLAGCFTGVAAAQEGTEATILFTHDLHSHFLPAVDEDGGEYGGYARLMTAGSGRSTPTPFWWTAAILPWARCSRPPIPPMRWSCG